VRIFEEPKYFGNGPPHLHLATQIVDMHSVFLTFG
jgi:hypothetical protein